MNTFAESSQFRILEAWQSEVDQGEAKTIKKTAWRQCPAPYDRAVTVAILKN